ncbi:TPA: restriction endonuclease subunit S [Vibrio parahaemolyticus]|nr:restriction endonuclease subunit S [Vibrio parahaemolyticus]
MSELPKGWVETNFEEVSDYIQRGKGPKYTEYSEYPVVNQKAVRWFGLQEEHLKYVHPEQWDKWDEQRYIREGDILWNSTGTGTIGRACHIDRIQLAKAKVVDSHVTIVRTSELIDSKFAFYWIKHPEIQNNINGLYNGSTNQVELSKKIVQSTRIPLAPLAEQKRIVEKLDEVLAQVDIIKARLDGIPAILKRFRQSVLASAVSGKLTEEWRKENVSTDPFSTWGEVREIDLDAELPNGWRGVKLGDVSERVSVGHVGKTSEFYTDEENGIPFLRSQNVRPGYISKDGLNYITKEAHELLKKSQLQSGDLLVVRVGANRGDSCVLPAMFDEVNCANIVFARPKEGLSPYLDVYFQSPTVQTLLLGKSVGGAQGVINTKSVQDTFLALPPIEEQKEIVRLVDQYFAFADTIEAQVKKAQARVDYLTQSILAKAFRGELVPQDPNDEPADKLLERIAEARKEAEALAKAAKKAEAAKKRAATSA